MTLPSYIAAGASLGAGFSTSRAFAVPSGAAIDDVVVIVVCNEDGTVNSLPSGFAHAASSPVITSLGDVLRVNIIWKRLTAADTGTYTVGFSTNTFNSGQAFLFRGVVTSGSPFDSGVSTGATGASASTTSPVTNITTTGPDRLLLHGVGSWMDLVVDTDGFPPTGFTVRGDLKTFMCSTKTQAAAGATGSLTATASDASTWAVWLGALLPVADASRKSDFMPFFH